MNLAIHEPVASRILARARARYDEPHRRYHTWTHIEACFAARRELTEDASAAIDLALLFHDAIYDPLAHDNEEKSAELLCEVGRSEGIDEEITRARGAARSRDEARRGRRDLRRSVHRRRRGSFHSRNAGQRSVRRVRARGPRRIRDDRRRDVPPPAARASFRNFFESQNDLRNERAAASAFGKRARERTCGRSLDGARSHARHNSGPRRSMTSRIPSNASRIAHALSAEVFLFFARSLAVLQKRLRDLCRFFRRRARSCARRIRTCRSNPRNRRRCRAARRR